MEYWAKRQRDTNRLARIMARHVLDKHNPTTDHLYALSKLSWITHSYEGPDAGYIASTKVPALSELLGRNYECESLSSVAKDAEQAVGDKQVTRLILGETGFTNYYNAYRNSVRDWVHEHRTILVPMYRASLQATTDRDRLNLIDAITALPGIPKANHSDQEMKPESFLTPVFFMLDPQIKFPIINGNRWVKALLARLQVDRTDLASQYRAMVALYGKGGVRDAADLDQLGRDLPDFLDSPGRKATKQLLRRKGNNERDLIMKDEADYTAAHKATTVVHRKIHNQLTNALADILGERLTLLEGVNDCKFDAMVKRFNGKDDLLIEAKSSAELPNLRMAIGQLFNYWFQLHPKKDMHLAVLLPSRPSDAALAFLEWMEVGALWVDDKKLKTTMPWLKHIAEVERRTRTN